MSYRENFAHATTWGIASRGFTEHTGWPLPIHTLVAGIMGSGSHGTYTPPTEPGSIDDIDVMVFCQPPRANVVGLHPWDYWCPRVEILPGGVDLVSYSLRKATRLLIKSNPNVLGMLWLPDDKLLFRHDLWDEWRGHRQAFLWERVYGSFAGYAHDQLMKLGRPSTRGYMGRERKALFERLGFDPKNAAHCLRLLRMGLELAETRELHVDRTGIDADELREVKAGKWSLAKIQRAAEDGFAKLAAAQATHALPPAPDMPLIEELLRATTETLW